MIYQHIHIKLRKKELKKFQFHTHMILNGWNQFVLKSFLVIA